MSPFNVLVSNVPDERLGSLLMDLSSQGYEATPTPTDTRVDVHPRGHAAGADLPGDWRLVRELSGQSYAWPKERESYERYRVFAADVEGAGTVHISLGEAPRALAWGRDRKYVIAFLSSAAPQVPLVEFLEVDDYETTHELLAVVRGSDGGKSMYGPGDALPDVYAEHFRTEIYRDRVVYPGAWNKFAVIAREDDHTTMLNHALLQARRRGDV